MARPVKSVILYKSDVVIEDLNAESLDVIGYKYNEAVYDRQGNILKEIKFNRTEEVDEKTENRYDENGFLIEAILYMDDEEIAEHKTFERDANGVIRKEFRHYQDKTMDTIFYHYDEDGHLIKKQADDPVDSPEGMEIFSYDKGKLVDHQILDADESLISEREYAYNDMGQLMEITEHYPDDFHRHTIVQKFDEAGKRVKTLRYNGKDQLIEKMTYEWDETDRVKRIIEETPYGVNTTHHSYDQAGNIILQEEYNDDDELLNRVERTYNEDNRLTESHVFIDGQGKGMSQNYFIRYEYEYFEDEAE
ncbi:MAG: hypothetical protein NT175_01925 [Bacteroidetes bacterium]|nr:hypothetical protein [Bacteroidota bacterium]